MKLTLGAGLGWEQKGASRKGQGPGLPRLKASAAAVYVCDSGACRNAAGGIDFGCFLGLPLLAALACSSKHARVVAGSPSPWLRPKPTTK